ncbi:MAG TPA: hypothetical protein VL002_03150 [Candidimonas sp.]|nr:hypothetical protein [Candidimonas sp.]
MANAQHDGKHALEIGQSIYRILLILCTHIPFFDFCSELFVLFRFYVFPIARDEHTGIAVDADFDFGKAVRILSHLRLQLEDQDLIGVTYRDSVRAMYELLHGKWGFHIQFALAPPISLLARPSELNAHAHEFTATAERFREWGWRSLRAGEEERFPPAELWQ